MYNLLLCRKCCVNDGLSAIHDLDRCKFERTAAKIYSFVLAKLWNIYMLSINFFDTICFIPVISLFVVLIAIIMSSRMNVLIHGEKILSIK